MLTLEINDGVQPFFTVYIVSLWHYNELIRNRISVRADLIYGCGCRYPIKPLFLIGRNGSTWSYGDVIVILK